MVVFEMQGFKKKKTGSSSYQITSQEQKARKEKAGKVRAINYGSSQKPTAPTCVIASSSREIHSSTVRSQTLPTPALSYLPWRRQASPPPLWPPAQLFAA